MKLRVTIEIDTDLDVTPEQVTDFVMAQVDEKSEVNESIDAYDRYTRNNILSRNKDEPIIRHIKTEKVEDWIEWNGGACPVDPEQRIEVELRDGSKYKYRSSNLLRWSFGRFGSDTSTDDIVKYRVVR